jgi:hypothetical protein
MVEAAFRASDADYCPPQVGSRAQDVEEDQATEQVGHEEQQIVRNVHV